MNMPLQKRTGYNQGIHPTTLLKTRFAGQPSLPLIGPSTPIWKSHPAVPGEEITRVIAANPFVMGGLLFNESGGDVEFNIYLKDPLGNTVTSPFGPYPTGSYYPIPWAALFYYGIVVLPAGWEGGIEITSGTYVGVSVWPWSHVMDRNLKGLVEPLTTTPKLIGPPEGRAWQVFPTAIPLPEDPPTESIPLINFDSVDRSVVEKINLGGQDFNLKAGGAPTIVTSGTIGFALSELFLRTPGFILAYPDKLKLYTVESQSSAPIYVSLPFVEFDLPRDV